jgi:transposase
MATKDGRKIPHDVLEHFRFAALKLRRKGVSAADIAASFGIQQQTVYNWTSKAKRSGSTSLRSTKTTGSPPAFDEKQFRALFAAMRRPASELGYATDLWSGPRVRHFLKHQLGVVYHPKYMPRFLRRLGLITRFPERRALEQDPEAVREWKEERLPEILTDARKRRALVFYADEALVSLIPTVGRTWTFPDVKPIARVSGRRGQHVGVTGAVNSGGRTCFELTGKDERFTALVFLRFVGKLRAEYPGRRITLIVDGSSVHKAKVVTEYVAKNKWLRLEILPAYSPEWNPSEKPWRYVKAKARNGSQSRNREELRKETQDSLRRLSENKKFVKTFFEPPI